MNIEGYPKSNQVIVKNNKTKRQQIACFKNGQLGIYIYSNSGKRLCCVYEEETFLREYTVIKMDAKPRSLKNTNYHDKSIIYNGEFKCLIKKDNNYYVNWYREEKGKPMTYKEFSATDRFPSVNEFFIDIYRSLNS